MQMKTLLTSFLILYTLTLGAQFERQKVAATLAENLLLEASGIEESYLNPGYLWSHNDSGGKPAVYLLDREGNVKMEAHLKGVKNRDWEEIVTVQENGQNYLYIAEIGDNKAQYDHLKLFRIKEPALSQGPKVEILEEQIEEMIFRYHEGPRDSEALFYDYQLKEFVLITKREESAMVYSFHFEPGKEKTLTSKGKLPDRNFTAADMNEAGEILLKNYDMIYFFESSAQGAVERLLSWTPKKVDYTPEPQGEALCWLGADFFTLSEKNRGFDQELLFFKRSE